MGITQDSINRLHRHAPELSGIKMMELGAQCLYIPGQNTSDAEMFWAKDFFEALGVKHTSIDLLASDLWKRWGEGGRPEVADLTEPLDYRGFDIVTNFGTTEHVESTVTDLYKAYQNIHNMCKVGGLMIHETPKTGSWPGHGCHYLTEKFYLVMALLADYEILELMSEPAHGNTVDGWNICTVLRKGKKDFINELEFLSLDVFTH